MAKVTSKSQVTAPRSAPHRPDELGVSKSRESRIHSFDQATERDGKRRIGALVDTNLLVCMPSRPRVPLTVFQAGAGWGRRFACPSSRSAQSADAASFARPLAGESPAPPT
jgi:hypothetical protein